MNEFRVGDRVKQIENLHGENPYATVTDIVGDRIWHKHDGKNCVSHSAKKDFILAKVTNWRKRLNGN